MKHIKFPVTESEHERLKEVKDSRSWREAVFEEFGVESDE